MIGYSAPKTDIVARKRFIERLRENPVVGFMQMEIVDPNASVLLATNYSEIHKDLHISQLDDFSQSWLTRHPRLTCEALYQATMMMDPIESYPLIETDSLSELQGWYEDFSGHFPQFIQEIQPWNEVPQ